MDSVQAEELNDILHRVHDDHIGEELVCNITTIEALSEYLETQGCEVPSELLDKQGDALLANGMDKNMSKSENFERVSYDKAKDITAVGGVVIASHSESGGSGHVDVVGAGLGGPSRDFGIDNLRMIGNSGHALESGVKNSWANRGSVAHSFGKSARPVLFHLKTFTPRPNGSVGGSTPSFVQRTADQFMQIFQSYWKLGSR